MTWTCPRCGKTFSKVNQWHKCEQAEIETVLKFRPDLIHIWEQVLPRILRACPGMRVTTSAKAITLYQRIGFLIVYPRKEGLDIGIFLDRAVQELPIYKVQAYSARKQVHWIRLYEPGDLDSFVLALIKEAYLLAS